MSTRDRDADSRDLDADSIFDAMLPSGAQASRSRHDKAEWGTGSRAVGDRAWKGARWVNS